MFSPSLQSLFGVEIPFYESNEGRGQKLFNSLLQNSAKEGEKKLTPPWLRPRCSRTELVDYVEDEALVGN